MSEKPDVYEKVTLYKTKDEGKMSIIPGEHEIGDEVEWGELDDPIRAEAVEQLNLPEPMSQPDLELWIENQKKVSSSVLNRKRKKIESDRDLNTYSVPVEEAAIEVHAEDLEEAKEKADGVYHKAGAKLETFMVGEPEEKE